MRISIIIPVYKNKELFLHNFKLNYPLLKKDEIIIIDDASQENLAPDVTKIGKNIQIIENHENLGFSKSVNIASKQANGDIIVLLNSDVRLQEKFQDQIIKHFKQDEDLCAVSFLQIEKNGKSVGKNIIGFSKGLPYHNEAKNFKLGINAWAEGGSCAIRKKYWNSLGGFNQLYTPFYWEDIDFSYRAHARGWKIIFDPEIIVQHHHESTIKKYFSENFIKTIAYRNQLIFTWSNITDVSLTFQHILFLPYHILRLTLKGERAFLIGLLRAIIMIPQIYAIRNKFITQRVVTDVELLKLLNN